MTEALQYRQLDPQLEKEIKEMIATGRKSPYAFYEEKAIRRNSERDQATTVRPAFIRDTEKIMHLPLYNRYADKTQVFSFFSNDDITRRALHVQLVSRVARNIGRLLGLNQELIEAIALGHDIGHTPFGHAGEAYLSEILLEDGLYFNHNVQSTRVLDKLFCRNLTLQTLDGILCHNGEFACKEFVPRRTKTFADFDKEVALCDEQGDAAIKKLVPSTLEGCVVRLSDMIAYLGKDRQDAIKAKVISSYDIFEKDDIGKHNAEIINNFIVDIVENSWGKDKICLSESAFADLKRAKEENMKLIYLNEATNPQYCEVKPMFRRVFEKLMFDLEHRDESSPIYRHHIRIVDEGRKYYAPALAYCDEDAIRIIADYIASMTDRYFIALYEYLFPDDKGKIHEYKHF